MIYELLHTSNILFIKSLEGPTKVRYVGIVLLHETRINNSTITVYVTAIK